MQAENAEKVKKLKNVRHQDSNLTQIARPRPILGALPQCLNCSKIRTKRRRDDIRRECSPAHGLADINYRSTVKQPKLWEHRPG